MTALRREAIQLVEQMPEEQMPYVIQYIQALKENVLDINLDLGEIEISPKMKAFWELDIAGIRLWQGTGRGKG